MTLYNLTPARGTSRPKLVVVGGAYWTDGGQLPLRVHGEDPDSPDHNRVDVTFLRTILRLLVLGTLAVGAIGVSIAIHLPPEEGQRISVAHRAIPDGSSQATSR
jgi:hypothetical protein